MAKAHVLAYEISQKGFGGKKPEVKLDIVISGAKPDEALAAINDLLNKIQEMELNQEG